MRRSQVFALVVIFGVGLALRLAGITWGLPNEIWPGEPPIHPDEHVAYEESARLYDAPSKNAFVWGGALYPRTHRLLRAGLERARFADGWDEYRRTLLGLRLLNVVAGLATAAFVAWMAAQLYGIRSALIATALFLVFPCHVLASHYARPDVLLVFFSTGALAAALRVARCGGVGWLLLGAFAGGLGTATMLSGTVAFLPLAVAAWEHEPSRKGLARRLALAFLCIGGAGALGYIAGSFESFLHWDVFRAGLERAQTAQRGVVRLPTGLLGVTAAYAFGTTALLFGYAGILLMALRRRPGSLTLVCYALVAFVLLARLGGSMMRHVLFLAPLLAIGSAVAMDAAAGALRTPAARRRVAAVLPVAVLLLTVQLSLGYVIPMATSEDPRYRAGRWLAAHASPGASIATTRSYHGDHTYNPRLPAGSRLPEMRLALFGRRDPGRNLGPEVAYVAVTDFAREFGRSGPGARWLDELFESGRFRIAASFGPAWSPLCLPDALHSRRPGDLLYVRSTFFIFEPERR